MSNEKQNPYDIGRIFEEMTLALIASLKRNFFRHKIDEINEGFRWEQWQNSKLRAMIAYRKRNKMIITTAAKEAEKVVTDVLQQSFKAGEQNVERPIKQMMKGDLKVGVEVQRRVEFPRDFKPKTQSSRPYQQLPKTPPEQSFFGMNEKKLEALQESVRNDLKEAQQGVFRKMDDVYRQVIYKAEINMAAGAKTLNQAIDMATKEFLDKGINVIEYADGRRVTIGAWAEMALRTASQRATFLGEGKKRNEWGIYTVVMSAHANCSPMCLPYQGTVMIDDVYTSLSKEQAQELSKETGYKLLSKAMKNHAFHPNCRHTLATYFPGITQLPAPVDDKQAVANYDAEQKQRYIERQIRKYKRLEAGSVDEVNQKRYANKVKEWQDKLKEHTEEHEHLRRDRAREKAG